MKTELKKIFYNKTVYELREMISPGKKEKLPAIAALCIFAFLNRIETGSINADIDAFLDCIFRESKAVNDKK
jgi:hypothetical protein